MRIAIVNQLDRLKGVFGATHFSQDRLRAIYNLLEPHPDSWTVEIVNTMIDNLKSAPLPKDFREALISISRAKKTYQDIETVYEISCSDCCDTGFIFCRMSPSEPEVLVICHCHTGLESDSLYRLSHTPRWEKGKMDVVYGFIKSDFPIYKFVPVVPEGEYVSIAKGTKFRTTVDRWKDKITSSNVYWRDKSKAELAKQNK